MVLGRIYGGVNVLWKLTPRFKCTILGVDDLHRCMAFKISCGSTFILCVNVYLPKFNNTFV